MRDRLNVKIPTVGCGLLAMALLLGGSVRAIAQGPPNIQWMRGGHGNIIGNLAYSHDGTFFASAAADRTVKIWRASDSLLIRTLITPGGGGAIALSPDDATLCWGGFNASNFAMVRCWQVTDGAPLWSADVPGAAAGQAITKLAFSPDGTRIAAAGARLPIFDAATGAFIADFSGPVGGNAFGGGPPYSPDGQLMAVNVSQYPGGDHTRLALLNATTGTLTWDYPYDLVTFGYDMAFSPNAQLVASVNGLGLRVFGSYDHAQKNFALGWPSLTVNFSPDGLRLAAGYAYSSAITLWDAITGAIIRQWDGHGSFSYPPPVVFSADSTKLLSANWDIKRWNASDGSLDGLVTGQTGILWLVALSANDQVVAAIGAPLTTMDDHSICLYRASDGSVIRYIDYGSSNSIRGLAISPDGHHVAAADNAGLRVWNVDTGVLERSHAEAGNNSYYRPLAYTPDGNAIAEGGDTMSTVSLWNPTTDTLTPIYLSRATALRFLPAPDGRLVIAKQVDPNAYPSVIEIVTLTGHLDRAMYGLTSVTAIAVSPDGTKIAAGGGDNTFSPGYVGRIFRVSDGTTLQTLVGHTWDVRGAAFAWDSQTVITGGRDNTVRIWRVSDGSQLRLYDSETYNLIVGGLNNGIWALVASTRSARFLSGRGDATLVDAVNPEAEPQLMTFKVPALTTGCKVVKGKIVLDRPAPPAGLIVSLSSSSTAASVPSALTFKAGATSKSFSITTSPVGALETATISATLDGETEDRDLALRPIGIATLGLSPTTVIGGNPSTGTVTLECVAPSGGMIVNLSSSLPLVAQPDATVAIPQGAKTKTFAVATVPVTATKKAVIKATTSADALSKTKTLKVTP